MELQGRRVAVVGLGKSGIAAARLCVQRGAEVLGVDEAPVERLAPELRQLGVELRAGKPVELDDAGCDLVVVSPGVPPMAALDRVERSGVPVIGELDLACRYLSAPLVVVGGTNGKSTVTTLIAELLGAAGFRYFVGGNLGEPATNAVGGSWDCVVLEVSSFQLERAPALRPRVSVLLNITEDHLDRYASFQDYASAKGNAFELQQAEDVAVIPSGDPLCSNQAQRGRGRVLSFGQDADYALDGRAVLECRTGEAFSLEGTRLHGRHNWLNAAAAIAAVRAIDVEPDAVRRGLADFKPLPHRMALVSSVNGVNYYDDSKATNVGSAVTALRGLFEERVVLIAGGRDKHGSYEPLREALVDKGRAVVVLGEAAERIRKAVGSSVPLRVASDLDEAVLQARELARPGDAVLLSPACSSFDMFASYAQRGERFVQAVKALTDSPVQEAG